MDFDLPERLADLLVPLLLEALRLGALEEALEDALLVVSSILLVVSSMLLWEPSRGDGMMVRKVSAYTFADPFL